MNELIIATIWVEDSPLGLELSENEMPFDGTEIKKWIATGNYALCFGIYWLDDFIKFQSRNLHKIYDYHYDKLQLLISNLGV